MSTTKDLAEVFRRKIASDPALTDAIEREALAANIATQIYEARTGARLTQAELAKLAGTQQSVIARMENSDYYGHSLNMLSRIASAVDQRVYVEFRKRFTDEFIESRRASGTAVSEELVQSSTSRMGLPPIRVPLLTPATIDFKRDEAARPAQAKTKGHPKRSARKRK